MRLGALAFGGGDLRLGLPFHGVGFVVLFAVVPGLLPEFVTFLKLLLGLSDVDLVGMHGGLGQNRNALGKDLCEAPRDEELLVARRASVEAHFASA